MSPFIVLDGPDGAGKTTQVLRLADALRSHGRQVLITAEPSKGPIGLYLRRHLDPETPPEVLACLFAGDRREHLVAELVVRKVYAAVAEAPCLEIRMEAL